MSEETYREKLLKLEEEATNLVDELTALAESSRRYANAAEQLEGAEGSVSQAASSIADLADAVRQSLSELRESGLATVIARQQEQADQIAGLNSSIRRWAVVLGLGISISIVLTGISLVLALPN